MIAVDTNVLVYAHRRELPQHERALAWLNHLAEGPAPGGLPVFCLGEFVRVVTHPRVFDPPSTLEQAFQALTGLLDSPHIRVLNPGAGYPAALEDCAKRADARGNLAFDAQIAAVCKEHGVRSILTADRDFARFGGLKLIALDQAPHRQP